MRPCLTVPPRRALEIPPGLPFRVALTESIDPVTAAAGDAVAARIVRLRHNYKPLGAYVVLDITLENVHMAGAPVDLQFSRTL
jgi:hypothetical protein